MMSTAWRWLSRVALVFLALIAVLAAIWAYGRLTSPTAAQREAIAVMQSRAPMPEGANGFDLLMALPAAPEMPWPSGLQCGEADSCIAAVEAAPEANAAALEAWRPRLQAAQRGLRASGYRDMRVVADPADALPSYVDTTSLDTLRAFEFASGNTDGALSEACFDASAAQRWATDPDTLIQAMLGIAIFRQHAALIADMRQRAPSDPLPDSCRALAETPEPAVEGLLCGSMRGEWHYQRRMFPFLVAQGAEQDAPLWWSALGPVMHDNDWMLAQSAAAFASACGEEAKRAASEDRALPLFAPQVRWVDYVAFPASVTLSEITWPAYGDYSERQLDHVARRRLLAALLQMDAMDPALTSQQRFDALPAALRDGPRPLTLQNEGRTLQVPLRGRRGDNQEPNGARLPLVDRALADSLPSTTN